MQAERSNDVPHTQKKVIYWKVQLDIRQQQKNTRNKNRKFISTQKKKTSQFIKSIFRPVVLISTWTGILVEKYRSYSRPK